MYHRTEFIDLFCNKLAESLKSLCNFSIFPAYLSSVFSLTLHLWFFFFPIISKYSLLQTLPDKISILSCMFLFFFKHHPPHALPLSHCLSHSDYLVALSLKHFLAHKSWKLRSEGWCCRKPWYKATTLSQMKTLLRQREAGEQPIYMPLCDRARGSSARSTCLYEFYSDGNTDEPFAMAISEKTSVK